jgi:hypothetical protein
MQKSRDLLNETERFKRRIFMKKQMIINWMSLTGLALTLSACAPQTSGNGSGVSVGITSLPKAPESIALVSRYTGGDYHTAAYSFRWMSQDENITRNNYEVLFEAREDFADYFRVNTVVDDNSSIYDLGERSCQDIQSSTPDERKSRPLVWLAYSEASPADLTPAKTALVQQGHCYLTYNSDEDGRVVTLFHVKAHEKSKTVTLDQVEVLDVLNR